MGIWGSHSFLSITKFVQAGNLDFLLKFLRSETFGHYQLLLHIYAVSERNEQAFLLQLYSFEFLQEFEVVSSEESFTLDYVVYLIADILLGWFGWDFLDQSFALGEDIADDLLDWMADIGQQVWQMFEDFVRAFLFIIDLWEVGIVLVRGVKGSEQIVGENSF